MYASLRDGLVPGILSGVLWGWLAMAANALTGVFAFEGTFIHLMVSFTFGGALFGVLSAGFLSVAGGFLPFRKTLPKAVFTSVSIWLVLRIGGAALSVMDAERYHVLTAETAQGLILSAALGVVLGLLWKKNGAHECASQAS